MPLDGMGLDSYMPIIVIAGVLMVGGVVFAVASLRGRDFKDPEEAKHRMMEPDIETYPEDE